MIPWVAGALIGAWFVGRGKPHSSVEKRQLIGTRTGTLYEADDFQETGIVIVRGSDGSSVVFVRTPSGLQQFKGHGNPQMVKRIVEDITGKPSKV